MLLGPEVWTPQRVSMVCFCLTVLTHWHYSGLPLAFCHHRVDENATANGDETWRLTVSWDVRVNDLCQCPDKVLHHSSGPISDFQSNLSPCFDPGVQRYWYVFYWVSDRIQSLAYRIQTLPRQKDASCVEEVVFWMSQPNPTQGLRGAQIYTRGSDIPVLH